MNDDFPKNDCVGGYYGCCMVSYAAVLCVVLWGGPLRDDPKNGCLGG